MAERNFAPNKLLTFKDVLIAHITTQLIISKLQTEI